MQGLRLSRALVMAAALLVASFFAPSTHAQNYALDSYCLAGGGSSSTGATYSLTGTIGQPAASSAMSGSSFSLSGGFWSLFGLPADLAPILPLQQNWVIDVLTTLRVTNTATSGRVPAGLLTYQLLHSPGGAAIDPTGLITWTAPQAQGGTTNTMLTIATDNGTPPLKATNSFLVVVRNLYSGIDFTDPASAAPGGDGFSSLLKYALGIDPANATDNQNGVAVSTSQVGSSKYATLTFRHRKNAVWLGYFAEVSGDQQNWFSDSAHLQQISLLPLDDQFESITVQDLTPTTPSTPRFIRLRVTSN